MARTSPRLSGRTDDRRRSSTYVLPHHPIGWWTLVSLLATGAFPLYFSALGHAVRPHDSVRVVVSVVIAMVSLLLSREAIFHRKDPAAVLIVLFWVIAFEVAVGILFGLALLGQAL